MHLLNDKVLMGHLAVLIMLVAYLLQIWKTWYGKAAPHPVAWFGFGFLTGVGYFVQVQKGAGSGAPVMGWTAIFCFIIAGVSWYRKRWTLKDFDGWDWTALASGTGLFILYLCCQNLSWGPLTAAILATSADLILYIPIFRNAWDEPQKEYAPSYGLNSLKFVPSLFAMGSYSAATCLYPAALIAMNGTVVVYLWWRKTCTAL